MDERVMQFRVGLMVFATLLITGILMAMFGKLPKIIYGEYKLYVTFYQAPGVTEDTPVRKSGILIGRVRDVHFSDDDTRVVVTVAIQKEFHLRKNEVCRAQTNLLGDASLEFVLSSKKAPSTELWKNGDEMEGVFIPDPNRLIQNIQEKFDVTITSVQKTSADLGTASQKLTGTLGKIDDVLGDEKYGIKKAIDQANEIMTSTRNVIGNEEDQKNIHDAMQQLPDMIKNMKNTVDKVNNNLTNLEKFTEPLGERGETLFENLDKLVGQMSKFSESLNSSEGTIGQLVNNPELYQHMNRAAKNIDELSRQLKPIIDDARVFSDKIARHPEVLGVRGAVQKSTGIK